MISLRIIKKADKYIVQIGIERKFLFYHRKTKWIDLEEHFKYLQRGKVTSGYQPFPCNTIFNDLEKAEQSCKYYIREEGLREKNNGAVVRTFNTTLNDMVWSIPPMPECKEPIKNDTIPEILKYEREYICDAKDCPFFSSGDRFNSNMYCEGMSKKLGAMHNSRHSGPYYRAICCNIKEVVEDEI